MIINEALSEMELLHNSGMRYGLCGIIRWPVPIQWSIYASQVRLYIALPRTARIYIQGR